MKLKLKQQQSPPVQLRLALPGPVKDMLDRYVAFVRGVSGREVEAREVAVEMLAQFMESDREFRRWVNRGHDQSGRGSAGGPRNGGPVDGRVSA